MPVPVHPETNSVAADRPFLVGLKLWAFEIPRRLRLSTGIFSVISLQSSNYLLSKNLQGIVSGQTCIDAAMSLGMSSSSSKSRVWAARLDRCDLAP